MYNDGRHLPLIVKKKICQFCKQIRLTEDSKVNRTEDLFEYKCNTSNPNVIIFLSESLIPNIKDIIKKNSMKLSYF